MIGPQFFLELLVVAASIEVYRSNRVLRGDKEAGDLNLDPFSLTTRLPPELTSKEAVEWVGDTPYYRGPRGSVPSRVFGLEDSGIRKLRLSEVKHCRLGMLAISGMVLQHLVTGQSIMEQMQGYGLNAFR
ncbi:unnamed protein product [Phaeothamnion confervicola]